MSSGCWFPQCPSYYIARLDPLTERSWWLVPVIPILLPEPLFGNSYSLSPTSAISYLCKHFTQILWKSKLLNLFLQNFADLLRKFAEFCGLFVDLLRNSTFAEFCGLFAEFCGFFAEFCGLFSEICGNLRIVLRIFLRNFTEFAEVGNCRGRRQTMWMFA